jgi:hypothetical protein
MKKTKQISKFRKWLIEKLGGHVYLPQPIILQDRRDAITFESTEMLTQEQLQYMLEYFPKNLEKEIKESLWQRLSKQTLPYLNVITEDDKLYGTTKFKLYLTMLKDRTPDKVGE